LYTGGFFNSQIIKKARSSQQIFYFSQNTDIYSAIAIASVLDDYVILRNPVAVSGCSYHSTGASTLNISQNLIPVQKFLSENNIPLNNRLIHKDYFPKNSVQIWTYECYLQSMHVHHDFLKVRMEDQLGLALSTISSNGYDALRKYCMEIAGRNGVDMSVVDRKKRVYKRGKLCKYLKWIIYTTFKDLILFGKEFNIQNVYEASVLAGTVYLFLKRYTQWRFKRFFRVMDSVYFQVRKRI
jgi:hypothetical protein